MRDVLTRGVKPVVGEALRVEGKNLIIEAAPADVVDVEHHLLIDIHNTLYQSATPDILGIPHIHHI